MHRPGVLFLVPLLLFAGCTGAQSPAPDQTQSETASRDGVTVGGVTYILNGVETRDRIGDATARNGAFLILRVGVRNTRGEEATIDRDQFQVVAANVTYGVSGDAAAALQEQGETVLDRQRIDPGFATRTVLAFNIPADVPYALHIRQNGETGRVALDRE